MNNLIKKINENFQSDNLEIFEFDLKEIIFEESVKLKCFHCKNYNLKHTCPPKINIVDYQKIFNEHNHALVVKVEYKFSSKEEFETVRKKSTNYLHKTLLKMEKYLWNQNESMVLSFIGGSCKLCKECDEKRCRNPYSARMPWEATGVNILKTLKNGLNIDIDFTSEDTLCRYGLIIWQ